MFRKDLNLSKKWWHRLFRVIFVIGLLALVWSHLIYVRGINDHYYKKVDNLEDRLNNGVSRIEDLLKEGEKFDNSEIFYNSKSDWNKGIYCSNRLYDISNIKYIMGDSGIKVLYDDNRRRELSIDEYSSFIQKENRKCIIKDRLQKDFLNPMEELNDFGFYVKDDYQYLKNFFSYSGVTIIYTIIYLIFIYVVYYKVLLYIVYGARKE